MEKLTRRVAVGDLRRIRSQHQGGKENAQQIELMIALTRPPGVRTVITLQFDKPRALEAEHPKGCESADQNW
jgi:hypothetical protein